MSFHKGRPAQEGMDELMNQRAGTEDWLIPQDVTGIESSAIQAIRA
jgi:hypothetical protein